MSSDPIDRLGTRLFEAARKEPAPEGAEQRAIAAIRRDRATNRPTPRHARWGLAFAAAALAAGALLLVRREQPAPITAEPASALRPSRGEQRPVAVPSSALPPMEAPVASSKGQPPAPARSAASLTDELSTLALAESALRSGDATAALETLDRYDRVLKGQRMRAEATVLRIEALARAGQPQAASALARRFVEQNPHSVLADRAKSYVLP
jgi:hypothetical protein